MRPQLLAPNSGHYEVASDDGAENWAILASLIETCKLNGVDPHAYLADVLARLVNHWPNTRLDELLPWTWAAARKQQQRAAWKRRREARSRSSSRRTCGGAEQWRSAIKAQLEEAESLVLVYGAAYEDWSWCLYEAGFFAGSDAAQKQSRQIYCMSRPNVPPPGPLNDLQVVTDTEALINSLIDIYDRNGVLYEPSKLRESINQAAKGLFRKLNEFVSHPRVYFTANDADFGPRAELPTSAMLKGEVAVLTMLFGIGRDEVRWTDIANSASIDRTDQERQFFSKWVDETKKITSPSCPTKSAPRKSRTYARIMDDLTTESDARGITTLQDLQERLRSGRSHPDRQAGRLTRPIVKQDLYEALGVARDGTPVSDQGLTGENLEKYRLAFETMQMINTEFLSRSCSQISQIMTKQERYLNKNAETIERNLRSLRQVRTPDQSMISKSPQYGPRSARRRLSS